MTTASWSTVVDHTSDVGFRAWGSELSGKLAAVGMVQQADTGQINWSTVVRSAVNVAAGYEIWKTPSGGLCLKIEYGTDQASATAPKIWFTIGTGSNGSGTLTGQSSTRASACPNSSGVAATTTTCQSYLCAKNNYMGLIWKVGYLTALSQPAWAEFMFGPTVDATGADSSVGFYVLHQGDANTGGAQVATLQTVRTLSTAATRSATSSFCVVPGQPSVSSDGTSNQVYVHWLDTPSVQPALYSGTIYTTDLTVGSTMSVGLVGATARTYISMGGGTGARGDAAATSGTNCVMLYE